jgi:hypothetical protein
LITTERLAASTVVGVEYKDVLFIGDVVRSTPRASEKWAIDIKVAQRLTGLQSLMILRAQLEQHQTQSNDFPTAAAIPCAVLNTGKKKAG